MSTKFLDRVPRFLSLLGILGLIGLAGLRSTPITIQCIELPKLYMLFPLSALVYKAETTHDNDGDCRTVIGQPDLDNRSNYISWVA